MQEQLSSDERVRVVVRVRPRNAREEKAEHPLLLHTLEVREAGSEVVASKRKNEKEVEREVRCSFDRVFGPDASQQDVFVYVQDAVQQLAQGFNCTIFAYGQTGTGKTHTMLGSGLEKDLSRAPTVADAGLEALKENWGIIPRSIESLFTELRSISQHGAAAIVHCSFMQIYNNEVFDLLQENKERMNEPLAVREMIKGNDRHIYASGLSEFRVTSLEETMKLLRQGNRNRAIRATEYNERSSRSHALLQLSAEVESRGAEGPTTIIRRAKLNLVDLAGSEKWDVDVAMGHARSKELTSINQSLSALGNVISALTNPRRTHIPYRDSKLTRLLQDSLGGNTRTIVIATISPDTAAIDETMSTLQFAERAKKVAVRVRVNEMVDDAVLLAQARREIARLKLLLQKNASHEHVAAMDEQLRRLTRENAALASENQRLKHTISALRKDPKNASSTKAARDQQGAAAAAAAVASDAQDGRQLPPLRLDFPPDTRIESPTSRPASLMLDGVERDLDAMAYDQQRVLEEIQTERRALEDELRRLEAQRQPLAQRDPVDDALCPMCGRVIDEHSDNELDECIDREAQTLQHSNQSASSHGRQPPRKSNSPRSRPTPPPRPPAFTKQPPSQSASSFAAAKTAALSSRDRMQPKSPYLETSSLAAGNNSATRRSAQSLPVAPRDRDDSRPLTADHTASLAANQEEDAAAPVVRQGMKSVKALRRLSPYSIKLKKPSESRRLPSPLHHHRSPQPPAPQSSPPATDGSAALSNSVRDIGLRLQVYQFRYDCWYPCTVVGYDGKRRLHCCQYEYGDKQWQNLSERKTQVLGRDDDSG
ncbi:hypothetical protein P43SY_009147 [Pythium insidiosum]|uniref:Kinesin-like protein n=1 Tax=Pythium insidiosum TaxID=114742 RepID=A0AAD5QBQ4_PYTIN|nr:hypothetical protein P43SY_009147 [Pythium insidiosum]